MFLGWAQGVRGLGGEREDAEPARGVDDAGPPRAVWTYIDASPAGVACSPIFFFESPSAGIDQADRPPGDAAVQRHWKAYRSASAPGTRAPWGPPARAICPGMGDWCVTDHFIVGDRPVPKPDWFDRESWAMRVGVIGPGIQLMQTMEKWTCQRLAGDGVISVCAIHGYLGEGPCESFVAGWNYLLAPACTDDRLFRGLAEALDGDAEVVSQGAQRVLCLRETHLYGSAHRSLDVTEAFGDEAPLARFVDNFVHAERHLHGHRTELVCGLWTHEHGFVHTGHVTFDLRQSWHGDVAWQATGAHNLLDAAWTGPCSGFLSLARHQRPVRMALQRWPFEPR